MSVSCGDAQGAWCGPAELTKAISRGGFGIATTLEIADVLAAAVRTCAEFPAATVRPIRSPKKPVLMTRRGVQVVAYGVADFDESTGKVYVLGPSWELVLGEGTGRHRYRIILSYATLSSGKIDDIEELGSSSTSWSGTSGEQTRNQSSSS